MDNSEGKTKHLILIILYYMEDMLGIKGKDYSKYIGERFGRLVITNINGTKATCECDCGNTKDISIYNILKGATKSCGCLERESRFSRMHAKTDIIGKKFNKLTVLRDIGKRKENGAVLWECQCECGNITYASSTSLKSNKVKSCGCAITDYVESLKQDIIGKKFGYLTVIKELDRSKYKRRTYLCKCDCGRDVITNGASLTCGHTTSCGCSRRSSGEIIVQEILEKHNIKFDPEHRFDDCKNERCLPFDFYLIDYNVCIEYQGMQHYIVVDQWGGEEGLAIRQRNDQIKKDYCKKNNIELLEIQYGTTRNNIEEMILNVLNP